MFLVCGRRSKRVERVHRQHHHNTGAVTRLPPEILLQIFAHLVHCPAFDQEPWLPEYPARSASHDGLRAAIGVCRAWRQPAEHAFYQMVEPQDIDACVNLARTLVARLDLGRKVQGIELPPDTKLINSDDPLIPTWRERQRLNRLRPRLSAAVDAIVSACPHVEHFGVATGHASFGQAPGLVQLRQQLKFVSLDRASLLRVPYTSRVALGFSLNDQIQFPGNSIDPSEVYPHLEVVRLRDFRAGIVLSRVLLSQRMHATFPVLQTLIMSRVNMTLEVFKQLMQALEPKLRTLACYDLTLNTRPGMYSSILHLLDVLKDIDLGRKGILKDLRLHHAVANLSPAGWLRIPMQTCSSLTGVARLTLHPHLLDKFELLPVQLRTLIVHFGKERRTIGALLTVAAMFARRLESWKIGAPAFSKIEQRAPNCWLFELPRWRMVCFILRELARRQDVEVETNIWLSLAVFRPLRRDNKLLQGWTGWPELQ